MAKLLTMFMILICIQAVLMLYHNPSIGDESESTHTQIWNFVWNTDNWSSLGFVLTISAIALAMSGSAISSGNILGFRTDFIIFAPAIAGLISMGVVFTNLANVVKNELISRIFTTCCLYCMIPCNPVLFITAITVGPIAFFYVWTICEWWRGKDI